MPHKKSSFTEGLKALIEKSQKQSEISIGEVFDSLSRRGDAALLIIFSFPFCQPLQIPGFSTPFGIVLGLIGLSLLFDRQLWWPKWILNKKIKTKNLQKVCEKLFHLMQKIKKFFHPRLLFLTKNSIPQRIHGAIIIILAILLALPLPIPFSNMLAATPILFIGLGLLEDDGVFILLGYVLAILCFLAFGALFFVGKALLFHKQ